MKQQSYFQYELPIKINQSYIILMFSNSRVSQIKQQLAELNPIIQNFDKVQRDRSKMKEQYIKDLKKQVEEERIRKIKQKEDRKLQDLKLEEKKQKQRQELHNNVQEQTDTKTKRSKTYSKLKQTSQIRNDDMINFTESLKLKQKPSVQKSIYSPAKDFAQRLSKNSNLSYDSPLEMNNLRSPIPYNIGYLKAKQSLQQEKQKLMRFRKQLSYPSRRTFVRTAQSALDNLKLITTETKNSSRTLPFILPTTKPNFELQFKESSSDYHNYLKRFEPNSNQQSSLFLKNSASKVLWTKSPHKQKKQFQLPLQSEVQLHGVNQFKY